MQLQLSKLIFYTIIKYATVLALLLPAALYAQEEFDYPSEERMRNSGEIEQPMDGLSAEEMRQLRDLIERSRIGVQTPGQPGYDTEDDADHEYETNIFNQDLDEKQAITERIQWQFTMFSSYNYFNNANLRPLDESTRASIERTDDRKEFVVTGVELDTFIPVSPLIDLRMSIWKAGFWGHDQLAGRDNVNDPRLNFQGSNTVNFGLLYIDLHLKKQPTTDERLDLRIGRQNFRIGGAIYKDYLFDGVTDGVTLRWYGWFGKLDLLLVDVFGSGSNTEDVNFVRYIAFDYDKFDYFDGDVNTIRHGGVYRYQFWGNADIPGTSHLEARAFWFLANFGASNEGGADRCLDGTACNHSDNDFVIMQGGRLNYGYSNWFRSTFTLAESKGVDRKALGLDLVNRDVDMDGRSTGLELEFAFFDRRFIILPSYFYADGGQFYADGWRRSHGFVNFKARYIGGLLADRYYGMRPSAYVDNIGIRNEPYQRKRSTGTDHYHLGTAIGILPNLYLKIDWWRYEDTNSQDFLSDVPEGFVRDLVAEALAEFYSERATIIRTARRYGNPVAEEINVGLEWDVNQYFRVWAVAGIFRPMSYYARPGLVADAPQGSAPFRGFQSGVRLRF